MSAEKLTFQAVLRWDEEQCRDFLVAMRWPDGIRCPKCGSTDEPYTIRRKNKGGSERNNVKTIYNCRSCRRQFTATVGTIFEDSKIPVSKWLAAIFLMCSSKKGISAHQLYRMLDLGCYETAWFMAHRVREAMREKGLPEPLTGEWRRMKLICIRAGGGAARLTTSGCRMRLKWASVPNPGARDLTRAKR